MKRSKTEENMLRISEVSSASGVSIQTIHYYLREGLLTLPVKTARNMAYYHPVVVEEIRLIKELQDKKYLPIAVIKKVLQAKREGQELEHVEEMQSLFEQVFYPERGESVCFSMDDLAAGTGLDGKVLKELHEKGILSPADGEGKYYDGSDRRIAEIIKKLLDLGLTTEDMVIYRQFIEFAHNEVKTMRGKFLHSMHDGSISMFDLINTLDDLKKELTYKTFRQVLLDSNQ